MKKFTLKNDVTLYDQINTVVIDSPVAGMVASKTEQFSIVPKFVPKGISEVVVIRQTPGVIAFDAGFEAGYVAVEEPVLEEKKDGEE